MQPNIILTDILSGAQRKNVPEVKEEDFGFGRCNPLKSALVFGVNAVRCGGGGGVGGVKYSIAVALFCCQTA